MCICFYLNNYDKYILFKNYEDIDKISFSFYWLATDLPFKNSVGLKGQKNNPAIR